MKNLLAFLAFFVFSSVTFAQGSNIPNVSLQHFAGMPAGGCFTNQFALNDSSGALYTCSLGSWVAAGSGAGVSSITGTANQVTASASTGAVTLSIPDPLTLPGSFNVPGAGKTSTFGQNAASQTAPSVIIEEGSTTSLNHPFIVYDPTDNTGNSMMAFFTGTNTYPSTIINSAGAIQTWAWMTASGHKTVGGSAPYQTVTINPPSSDFQMFGCWSDVNGPCMQSRSNQGAPLEYNYSALSVNGNHVFNVGIKGDLSWAKDGAAATSPLGTEDVIFQRGSPGLVGVASANTLGSQTLTNPNLTSGTSWTTTGDFALTANNATYTYSAGSGTLSQAAVTLAVPGAANTWYAFTYTISASTGTSELVTITTAFAAEAFPIPTIANGTYTVYFLSAASPGAFTISISDVGGTGDTFTIGTLSLKQMEAGSLNIAGGFTQSTATAVEDDFTNNTASTSSTAQNSPKVCWNGTSWTTVSVTDTICQQFLPTSGANGGGNYVFSHSGGGSGFYTVQFNNSMFLDVGSVAISPAGTSSFPAISSTTKVQAATFTSATNCKGVGTAANPSVVTCTSASSGMFSCDPAASTGTCTVNTSAVTANSEIFITQDAADGGSGQLNVTCNTGNVLSATAPLLAAKVAATSFTINFGTVTTNPGCFEYHIVN